MENNLLSTSDAARQLGISRTTMYQWLAESDAGGLVIRGQSVTIDYLQGGAKGQGRIKVESQELERLKDLMRVKPRARNRRSTPTRVQTYPGITATLGRPPQ